jgi:hypothetical protein
MTMSLINTINVGAGGVSSVVFSGIPSSGTDLLLTVSSRDSTGSSQYLTLSFNESSSNFQSKSLYGTGTNVFYQLNSDSTTQGLTNLVSANDNTFSNAHIYIPNYAGNTVKSYSVDTVWENNLPNAGQRYLNGTWTSTSAINSIRLTAPTLIVQNSTFSLYTITKGSGGSTVS